MAATILEMRYLDLTLPSLADNLALDEALLIEADEGRSTPVLRFWELPGFAVVLGSTSRFLEDVHLPACRADGVSIARRSSGGGTVVIGPGALNVTVILPSDAAPGLGAVDVAHRFVLEKLADAITSRGPLVTVLGLGDLTIGLRKFAGSAQRRLRHWFLVHTSILYDFPLERITRYTALPRRQPSYRAQRPHDEFLTNLNLPRHEIIAAVRSVWSEPTDAPSVPHELVHSLAASKFALPAWTERL